MSLGLFFTVNNIFAASDKFSSVLLSACYIMILTVPALTMRAFAEERRNGTDKLLMCAPVKLSDIVIGKYLAMLCVFLAALLLSFIFPLIIAILGKPYAGEIFLGYIGCFLVGACLIAIGMFFSSLSENQLSSALVSATVLLLLFLAANVGPSIPIPAAADIACGLSPFHYLGMFRIGLLLPFPMAFLTGFSVLFVYLTIVAADRRLWKKHARTAKSPDRYRHNAYVLCVTAILVVCLAAWGLVALKLQDGFGLAGDFSRGSTFSLTKQTKSALSELSENVALFAVYERDAKDTTIVSLLESFDRASAKVNFKIIDPVRAPRELLKLNLENGVSSGSVVVASEATGRVRVLDQYSLYLMGENGIVGINAEQSVSSAIHYVTGGSEASLLLVTGHGEAEAQQYAQFITDSAARGFAIKLLEGADWDYRTISRGDIPVFVSPQEDLTARERDTLIEFLGGGGSVAFFMDNSRGVDGGMGIKLGKTELANFNAVFERFGLSLKRDLLLVPPEKTVLGSVTAFRPIPATMALFDVGIHGVMAVSECSSISVSGGAGAAVVSPSECYSKKIDGLADLEKDANDPAGPFVVAAFGNNDGRLFLAGTSSFITGGAFAYGGNRAFALSAASALADDEGNPVVPTKIISDGKLNIDSLSQQLMLTALSVLVLPVLVTVIGFAVLRRRMRVL